MGNIREQFKGYSDYTSKEYNRIWKEGFIVIDTNILLNFYRYTDETREKMYEMLSECKQRLWIPYQVAKEYYDNKLNTIADSIGSFENLKKEIDKNIGQIEKKVNDFGANRLECKDTIKAKLEELQRNIITVIDEEENKRKKNASEEEVEKIIFDLFDDNMGDEIQEDEYNKMKEEGLRRFKEQIPPGYKDSAKEENGDYYIFYSIIKKAKELDKDVIFITDDVKEDWFIRIGGQTKGGHYKLLNEFYKETGKLMLIYSTYGFAEAYRKNNPNKSIIDKSFIDELKFVRNSTIHSRSFNHMSDGNRIRNLISMIRHEESKEQIYRYMDKIEKTSKNQSIIDNIRFLREAIKENDEEKIDEFIDELKLILYINTEKSKTSNRNIERYLEELRYVSRGNNSGNYDKYIIDQIIKYLDCLYDEILQNQGIYKFDEEKLMLSIKKMRTNLQYGLFNEDDIKNGIQYICDTFLFGR